MTNSLLDLVPRIVGGPFFFPHFLSDFSTQYNWSLFLQEGHSFIYSRRPLSLALYSVAP